MKIALDLDGVLADLQNKMIQETIYTQSDFEQWSKPKYNHFMSEASRVWSDHWDEISSVEHSIGLKTSILNDAHYVDIVTNTAGPDKAIEQWLDKHGVQYEDIVRPYNRGCDKQHLHYDAYIDDKPSMAGEVDVLYLRDQPWNQTVRGNGPYIYHSYEDCYVESEGDPVGHYESPMEQVVRITGLEDVLTDLGLQVGLDGH